MQARTETARVSLLEAELEVVKSQIGATKKQLGQASQGSDQKTKFNPAFDMDSDSDDSDSEGARPPAERRERQTELTTWPGLAPCRCRH